MAGLRPAATPVPVRRPAVAGSFYPAERDELAWLVGRLLDESTGPDRAAPPGPMPLGILVPHAGLSYSGLVAAAAWRRLGSRHRTAPVPGRTVPGSPPATIVLLGTNHAAGWLDGVGAWEAGAWRTPLGDVDVDVDLLREIVDLGPPYVVDRLAHAGEHSIEVQLPFVQLVAPGARIVPLAVATGTGSRAIRAGQRLGALLAERRRAGDRIVLAISSDMAHYPPADQCAAATEALLPSITALDAAGLARIEAGLRDAGVPGLACGMCGIEPAVLGLAALAAMGAGGGIRLAAATSRDVGGPADRSVGYLAVAFEP